MKQSDVILWLQQPNINKILRSFTVPKTPKQIENKLGIKKINMKPFVDKDLLKSLNPEAKKGKLYVLTQKAYKLLGLPSRKKENNNDWNLIGKLLASPRQLLVVLKAMDLVKRNSENIRGRASKFNSHLTRISTKQILKELINKRLVKTEMIGRKRLYWISEKGKLLVLEITGLEVREKYINH